MLRFAVLRLSSFALALLAAALAIFVVLEVIPGDPAAVMLGVSATPETLAALRSELGLDRPVPTRFLGWFTGLFTGDLGISYTYRVPVAGLIAERVGVTLPLSMLALALAALIGIPVGVFAAARANTRLDAALMALAQLGLAIPNFWFGILFVLAFAIGLGWFPAGGFPGWEAGFFEAMQALVLPAFALALPFASVLSRIARSAVLEALSEQYILTARAKGLSAWQTLIRHALRNAWIPVMTILGLQFSFLLTGAIVIESVFALPGLGGLLIKAIGGHDVMLIRSLVLIFAGMVMAVTALVDIAYGFADPRLRIAR